MSASRKHVFSRFKNTLLVLLTPSSKSFRTSLKHEWRNQAPIAIGAVVRHASATLERGHGLNSQRRLEAGQSSNVSCRSSASDWRRKREMTRLTCTVCGGPTPTQDHVETGVALKIRVRKSPRRCSSRYAHGRGYSSHVPIVSTPIRAKVAAISTEKRCNHERNVPIVCFNEAHLIESKRYWPIVSPFVTHAKTMGTSELA